MGVEPLPVPPAPPSPPARGSGARAGALLPSEYEFTFCPSRVTSRTPCAESRRTSATMESAARERSRPRVKGTMQKAHMLLQPRMMLTKAEVAPASRTGATSAYVSSSESWTFMAVRASPRRRAPTRSGRSR